MLGIVLVLGTEITGSFFPVTYNLTVAVGDDSLCIGEMIEKSVGP